MISAKYIHEFEDYDDLQIYINESESVINSMINEYYYLIEESKLMNLDFDNDDDIMTEAKDDKKSNTEKVQNLVKTDDKLENKLQVKKKGIIEKLGEFTIGIIEKVKGLIDKVHRFFQEKIFGRKNEMQKQEALLKKNPNMAEEIKFAIQKGDLEIKDYKTMSDLMDGTSDILDKINKGELDKTGAEKAFDKLNTKWEKYGKPLVAIAAGATTVLTAWVMFHKFIPEINEKTMKNKQTQAHLDEWKAQTNLDERRIRRANGGPDEVGIARLKNYIINRACNLISANTRKQESLFGRIATWTDRTLRSLESSEENDIRKKRDAQRRAARYDNIVNRDSRNRANQQAVFKQKLSDASRAVHDAGEPDRQVTIDMAKKAANLQFNRDNEGELNRQARQTAHSQEEGKGTARREEKNAHRDEDNRDAERTARAQARGKAAGDADWYDQNTGRARRIIRDKAQEQERGKGRGDVLNKHEALSNPGILNTVRIYNRRTDHRRR